MRTLQDYIGTPFKPKGREFPEFDCWGLARDVSNRIFNKPLLPSFSEVDPKNRKGLTRATQYLVLSRLLKVATPVEGSFATGWFNGVCVHIGIVVDVDGRFWVLDTEDGHGGRLNTLESFEQPYSEVIYYVAT